MVMKTTKLREPQANGQPRMTRTMTSIPRSRKPMKMTRQQIIIIFFFLNKEENKPTKKASASSSPLGPPLPSRCNPLPTHTRTPFLPPPPWSSSPSRVNPVPGPPARRCHSTNIRNDSPVSGERNPPLPPQNPSPPKHQNFKALLSFLKVL